MFWHSIWHIVCYQTYMFCQILPLWRHSRMVQAGRITRPNPRFHDPPTTALKHVCNINSPTFTWQLKKKTGVNPQLPTLSKIPLKNPVDFCYPHPIPTPEADPLRVQAPPLHRSPPPAPDLRSSGVRRTARAPRRSCSFGTGPRHRPGPCNPCCTSRCLGIGWGDDGAIWRCLMILGLDVDINCMNGNLCWCSILVKT